MEAEEAEMQRDLAGMVSMLFQRKYSKHRESERERATAGSKAV